MSDPLGNKTQSTRNVWGQVVEVVNFDSSLNQEGPSLSYTYDVAGRLSSKDGDTLVYDVAGHIHAVGTKGSTDYTCDANGNMTERDDGQETQTMVYEARGKLIDTQALSTYELFDDGFENGDFSAWDYRVNDADLTVSGAAALDGSYGMSVEIDDSTALYVVDYTPDAEDEFHIEFKLDPNGLTMDESDVFTILTGKNSSNTPLFKINLAYINSQYKIAAFVYDDEAYSGWTAYGVISDAEHTIQLDWKASDADGSNNGFMRLRIDGVHVENETGVDNDTHALDYFYSGANGGMDASTSGTFYMDSFETRNYDQQVLYDAQGTRTVNKLSGETTVYIGAHYELNYSTGVEKTYYSGFAMREHDLDDTNRSEDAVYYILKDHLNGTNIIADETGTLISETRYTAFGETRYQTGSLVTDIGYTGQRQEASLDLYFYNARWYDPTLGRFAQADTILPDPGDAKAFDRYAYVDNNPIRFNDPTGHLKDSQIEEWTGKSIGELSSSILELLRSFVFGDVLYAFYEGEFMCIGVGWLDDTGHITFGTSGINIENLLNSKSDGWILRRDIADWGSKIVYNSGNFEGVESLLKDNSLDYTILSAYNSEKVYGIDWQEPGSNALFGYLISKGFQVLMGGWDEAAEIIAVIVGLAIDYSDTAITEFGELEGDRKLSNTYIHPETGDLWQQTIGIRNDEIILYNFEIILDMSER